MSSGEATCTCGVLPWPASSHGGPLWSLKPVKVLHDDDCPVMAPFLEACGESAVSIAKRVEARLFDLLVAPCPPAPIGGTSTT